MKTDAILNLILYSISCIHPSAYSREQTHLVYIFRFLQSTISNQFNKPSIFRIGLYSNIFHGAIMLELLNILIDYELHPW